MFDVGKSYQFSLWEPDEKAWQYLRGEVLEKEGTVLKIADLETGVTYLNTASLLFISADEA